MLTKKDKFLLDQNNFSIKSRFSDDLLDLGITQGEYWWASEIHSLNGVRFAPFYDHRILSKVPQNFKEPVFEESKLIEYTEKINKEFCNTIKRGNIDGLNLIMRNRRVIFDKMLSLIHKDFHVYVVHRHDVVGVENIIRAYYTINEYEQFAILRWVHNNIFDKLDILALYEICYIGCAKELIYLPDKFDLLFKTRIPKMMS
jgi:hypothetical protein